MYTQWNANGKVVQGVFDWDEADYYNNDAYDGDGSSTYGGMSQNGMDVKEKGSSTAIKNHNKILLIMNSSGDDIVCTGSPNFTHAASAYNDENSVMIHDPLLIRQYLKYHKTLYDASDTTGGNGTEPSAPSALTSFSVTSGSSSFNVSFDASGDADFSRYYVFISTYALDQSRLDNDLTNTVAEVCDKTKGSGTKTITVSSWNYRDSLTAGSDYYFAAVQMNK